jgi:hypothetical protein
MKRVDLPEAFRALPNKIQGNGVEVFLLDSALPLSNGKTHRLHLHTLMIILDGSMIVECDTTTEALEKDEAIMMKKDSVVAMTVPDESFSAFRTLALFFDEPSLRYALMPFELTANAHGGNLLKIPLSEKMKVFSDSIILYYKSNKEKIDWTVLLENKLRELIWIFFHTQVKEQAREFFSTHK